MAEPWPDSPFDLEEGETYEREVHDDEGLHTVDVLVTEVSTDGTITVKTTRVKNE